MIFMTLPQMSACGSLLIAAVLVLRGLFIYRLPKRTFAALWGVAVLRLLLPFSAALAFGVGYVFSPPAVPGVIYAPSPAAIEQGAAGTVSGTAEEPFPIRTVLFIVWCCGAVLLAVFFTVKYIRSLREFRCSLPEESPLVSEWLSSHKIRRNVAVRRFDGISSPLTYGVFRPVILLPRSFDASDETRLCCVLTHELTHIRRFDALKKLVCAAALCLHWFNPLVWVMFFYYNRDLELACDEGVLRRLGTDRKADYAKTLIGMECERSGITSFYSRFGDHAAEERIKAIMKTKKTSLFKSIAACALVCATAGVFATTAAANDKSAANNNKDGAADNKPSVGSEPDISPVRFDAPSRLDDSAPREEYKALGLTERESDKALMFDGKLVRWFIDEADVDGNGGFAVRHIYYNENGVIDLHTVWEKKYNADGSYDPFGKLKAIEEMKDFNPGCLLVAEAVTSYEMPAGAADTVHCDVFLSDASEGGSDIAAGDVIEATAMGTDSGAKGRTFADIFAAYKDYGITYDEEKSDVYFNGKLVSLFVDISKDGAFSFMSQSTGGIKVRTVYKNGKLSEVREMTKDEENAELSEW